MLVHLIFVICLSPLKLLSRSRCGKPRLALHAPSPSWHALSIVDSAVRLGLSKVADLAKQTAQNVLIWLDNPEVQYWHTLSMLAVILSDVSLARL